MQKRGPRADAVLAEQRCGSRGASVTICWILPVMPPIPNLPTSLRRLSCAFLDRRGDPVLRGDFDETHDARARASGADIRRLPSDWSAGSEWRLRLWRRVLRRVPAMWTGAGMRRHLRHLRQRARRLALANWRLPGRRQLRVLRPLLWTRLWLCRRLCAWMWGRLLLRLQRRRVSGRAVRLFGLRLAVLGQLRVSPSARLRDWPRVYVRRSRGMSAARTGHRPLRQRLLLQLLRPAGARLLLQLG